MEVFVKSIESLTKEEYVKMKADSKTYLELKQNYERYVKEIAWKDKELGLYVNKIMEELFNEDCGNAKL